MKHAFVIFTILLGTVLSIGAAETDYVLQDFTLTALDGTTIDFNALKGTPIVINIGADW